MFKLKFKQKMKPNFLLCLTLRRKKPDPLRTWLFNIDSISQNLRYLFINIASIWIKSYNFRIFK